MHAPSALMNDGSAVADAIQSHEKSGNFIENPVYNTQPVSFLHAGAEPVMQLQESSYTKPPTGHFRSHLCSCCNCPTCLLAVCFPWIIWAQAHKVLHGGVVDKEKGTRGYYAIVGSFIVMSFVLAVAGANSSAPFFLAVEVLFHTLGFFILVSLLRRARKMYDIRGNQCQTCCCRCWSDGCCDCLKTIFCGCCVTFQLGNHLFDYSTNSEITYEASPLVELV